MLAEIREMLVAILMLLLIEETIVINKLIPVSEIGRCLNKKTSKTYNEIESKETDTPLALNSLVTRPRYSGRNVF